MAADAPGEVDERVERSLTGTRFESSSMHRLSGGSVNWAYVVKLRQRLDDGTKEVMVKHGERRMMTQPDQALTLLRCELENECFRHLSGMRFTDRPEPPKAYDITVRTPRHYAFHEQDTNQILEYMPNAITLKDFTLKYFAKSAERSSPTAATRLGKSLGQWLRRFTEVAGRSPALQSIARQNVEGKGFRHMLNFSWLAERVAQYPGILKGAEGVFGEVEEAMRKEMEDESISNVVHGDFWTGNVLVSDSPISTDNATTMFVIDWEMAHLGSPSIDFGQMIAEMYVIWLFKSIPAGLWMMRGFVEGYGVINEEFVYRTLLQVGAHLICVISFGDWGSDEEVAQVVALGRDIVLHAWSRDRAWFDGGDLACIFRMADGGH